MIAVPPTAARAARLLALCCLLAPLASAEVGPLEDLGAATTVTDVNASGLTVGSATSGSRQYPALFDGEEILDLAPGAEKGEALAINAAGQVVGNMFLADSSRHAFLYDAGTGALLDLGEGTANAINGAGEVTGGGYPDWAYIYADGVRTDLGDALVATGVLVAESGTGYAINEAGDVAGVGWTPVYSGESIGRYRAFLYDAETQAVTVIPLPAGRVRSSTPHNHHAINNSGQVIGQAYDSSGRPTAFVYTPGVGTTDIGALVKATLGSTVTGSTAADINNAGQIVGEYARTTGGGVYRYTPGNPATIENITGGWAVNAFDPAINSYGDVVGQLYHNPETSPFVWDGELRDLGALGGTSGAAVEVTDTGVVVGWVTDASRVKHAFRATIAGRDADGDGVTDALDACPDVDASPLDLDGDGCLDDADGDGVTDDEDACPDDPANDQDGDSWCADADECPEDFALDGGLVDADGDLVCDADDACAGDDHLDLDGDLIPDECDLCVADADSDGDGECTSEDACAFAGLGGDADVDGVCDEEDLCPLDYLDDSDGDGWCDSDDACAGHDDADDLDADGLADGCDACPFDPENDGDGDFVCETDGEDPLDNCPVVYNPEQSDDGDGVGDACDGDADNNGLDDADNDGDGVGDDADLCLGTPGDEAVDAATGCSMDETCAAAGKKASACYLTFLIALHGQGVLSLEGIEDAYAAGRINAAGLEVLVKAGALTKPQAACLKSHGRAQCG